MTSADALLDSTARAIADAVAAREVTAEDLALAALARIAARDPKLNAVVSTDEEHALEAARAVDAKLAAAAPAGPLAGVPALVKDNLCTAWGTTTCASKMLAGYRSPFTATCVTRLEAAGAVVVGKANMDEFAMGGTGEHSALGPTRNPLDTDRVPGGSSSGSAAVVAAGMVPLALGSDTGGSVRQPAAFCGVVGLKPTYGAVSRYGLVAFASSLDQVGVLAKDTQDAARALEAIAGHDPLDATSAEHAMHPAQSVETPRVGICPKLLDTDAIDDAVRRGYDSACDALRASGAELVEIDLPALAHAVSAYYVIAPAEASSNLARYDGVRFGHRATLPPGASIEELMARSRTEGFGDEVRRRLVLGTYVLSSGHYDAYYQTAQRVRRLVRDDLQRAFTEAGCHAVCTPTAPTVAFPLGRFDADPLALYLQDAFTIPANMAGLPSISVPAPGGQAGELPVGVMLTGPAFSDRSITALAGRFEGDSTTTMGA